MPTFADTDFSLYYYADITTLLAHDLSFLPAGAVVISRLPAGLTGAIYTPTFANFGNRWVEVQNFDDTGSGDAIINCIMAGAGTNTPYFVLASETATSKNARLGIPIAGLTADRYWNHQDQSGDLVTVGTAGNPPQAGFLGRVNVTAKTADIASTKLTDTTPAGMYRVSYLMEDTTQDVTAGILTLTLSWTDDVGATTATATQTLAAVGRTSGVITLYLASGNITYATTHTLGFGTSQYALRMRCEYLG